MLEFDAATHTFMFNGRSVPNVTRILAPVYGLENPIYQSYIESAGKRGTDVHEATEKHDRHLAQSVNGQPWRPDDPNSYARISPYVSAWMKFLADTGFFVHEIEKPVYSKRYHYAGILDRLGELNRRRVVIDIKTSAQVKPVMGLQLAAYQHAVNEGKSKAEQYPHRFVCQLKNDGTYRLEEFRDRSDFTMFLALLTVWNWRKQYGG
jgi:hypothetical protein